jgi:succinate dehydrogenase / fumarate reductase cytochrome b subunit
MRRNQQGFPMARNAERPLSPHITIWRWGPHMLLSILHRVTGVGLATVGVGLLVWGLASAAAGPEAYARFLACLTTDEGAPNLIGWVLMMGLTWAFFTHMLNGIRHFVMDSGAGYELRTNKSFSVAVLLGALFLTIAVWAWVLYGMWPGSAGNG